MKFYKQIYKKDQLKKGYNVINYAYTEKKN